MSTHLYMRVFLSVGWLVRPSVGWSVTRFFKLRKLSENIIESLKKPRYGSLTANNHWNTIEPLKTKFKKKICQNNFKNLCLSLWTHLCWNKLVVMCTHIYRWKCMCMCIYMHVNVLFLFLFPLQLLFVKLFLSLSLRNFVCFKI